MGSWDGPDHMQTICASLHSRQITTPTPHHSIFTGQMLFLTPNQQCQSTEGSVLKVKGILELKWRRFFRSFAGQKRWQWGCRTTRVDVGWWFASVYTATSSVLGPRSAHHPTVVHELPSSDTEAGVVGTQSLPLHDVRGAVLQLRSLCTASLCSVPAGSARQMHRLQSPIFSIQRPASALLPAAGQRQLPRPGPAAFRRGSAEEDQIGPVAGLRV